MLKGRRIDMLVDWGFMVIEVEVGVGDGKGREGVTDLDGPL